MDKNFKGTSEEYKEFRRKRNEANRRYYAKPEVKKRKRKYKKKYNKENKEKISEYGKRYRARPEVKERIKKWREKNKEKVKQKQKEWREKNKEYKKKKDREYQQKNKKKINKYQREYRLKNKKRVKRWYGKYNQSEKGKRNWTKQNHLRLSKKHGNEFKLTQKQIRKIFERDKSCVYCGSSKRLELDHIIPITKKGKSIFENFVVACRRCNPSKANKDVFVWCKKQGIEVPEIVKELLKKQGIEN